MREKGFEPSDCYRRRKVYKKSKKRVVLLLLCVYGCFSFPTHFHCPWETLWKKWVSVAAGHAVVFFSPHLFSRSALLLTLVWQRDMVMESLFPSTVNFASGMIEAQIQPPPTPHPTHTHTPMVPVISLSVYGFRMFYLWPCKRFCGESHITGNLFPLELCENEIREEPVHFLQPLFPSISVTVRFGVDHTWYITSLQANCSVFSYKSYNYISARSSLSESFHLTPPHWILPTPYLHVSERISSFWCKTDLCQKTRMFLSLFIRTKEVDSQ